MSTKIENEIIAICCADLHLQHKAPVWRSAEPDWYEAMTRPLLELTELQVKYNCPVLCAGDIFDDWDSNAELINFAIENLPKEFYSIAGQHDLPNHNINEVGKSAFYTVKISGEIYVIKDAWITGKQDSPYVRFFCFNEKIEKSKETKNLKIALIHEYLWVNKNTCYKTATEETSLGKYTKKENLIDGKLFGYDIIISGDNHIGWKTTYGGTTIVNCGSLMRRHKDQIDYKPKVWLIYSNGDVVPYLLDTSKDKYLEVEQETKKKQLQNFSMEEIAKQLKELGTSALDFAAAIENYCIENKVEKPVKDIIGKGMKDKGE